MCLNRILTHDHEISLRRFKRVSYYAMGSTPTHSQLLKATPIVRLLLVFTVLFGHCLRQSPHLLSAKSLTANHVGSGMN